MELKDTIVLMTSADYKKDLKLNIIRTKFVMIN